MRLILTISLVLMIAACSDDRQEQGHVWHEQTEAIQKAEDVNKLIMETEQKHREAIDKQSQ